MFGWLVFCCVDYFLLLLYFFFFNDTATTEIYTLSLHDALRSPPRCCRNSAARWCWDRSSSASTSRCRSSPSARPTRTSSTWRRSPDSTSAGEPSGGAQALGDQDRSARHDGGVQNGVVDADRQRLRQALG